MMEPPTAPTTPEAEPTLPPEEQPVVTGTLFLTLVLLMLIFGFWAMMYLILLGR